MISGEVALQQVAALDGRIVRVGGLRNVVVAVFDKDVGVAQLWRHGAWMALDPVFFGGCGSVNRPLSPRISPNSSISYSGGFT